MKEVRFEGELNPSLPRICATRILFRLSFLERMMSCMGIRSFVQNYRDMIESKNRGGMAR